jgi:hypothetical protein
MTQIHHINCGTLEVAGYPTVVCHCLLVAGDRGLTLIDTGIGLAGVRQRLRIRVEPDLGGRRPASLVD